MSLLRPTLLSEWRKSGAAWSSDGFLHLRVPVDSAAPGEERIGYASICSLVECVREAHWEQLLARHPSEHLDSVVRALTMTFERSIAPGAELVGSAFCPEVFTRSYQLVVELRHVSERHGAPAVTATLRNVLLAPDGTPRNVPASVAGTLHGWTSP